jgi:hypothetical protein
MSNASALVSPSLSLPFIVFRTTVTMSRQAGVSVLALNLLMRMATATCYFPNGAEQPDPAYAPCSNDTTNPLSTICCASWDTCLPNGLCQNNAMQKTFRESCTKSNWADGGCQELCSKEVCIEHQLRDAVRSKTD